jgi:hypothetical protein
MISQQLNNHLLNSSDQSPDAQTTSAQVKQQVCNQLARTVVGYLPATITINQFQVPTIAPG